MGHGTEIDYDEPDYIYNEPLLPDSDALPEWDDTDQLELFEIDDMPVEEREVDDDFF